MSIPKVIHYCWFGGNKIPKKLLKYMKSWKRFCPDYEIKRWDESNFDINCCDYVKEAYEKKKYAFVSDFARFKILYEEGGVYFDTDVEIVKPIEEILAKGGFLGRETDKTVNPGLGLAVEAHDPFIKELLDRYYHRHFVNEDGSLNLKTIVQYTTELLKENGLQDGDDEQRIGNIVVYPKEYFSPINFDSGKITRTEKTYSIHHYAASWETRGSRIRGKIYNIIFRLFGKKAADRMRKSFGKKK